MAELALQMSGIVKKYGGVSVLKNVDFSVKSGEIHALLGENGAGKTTLMNILGGVTPMDSGSVRLFDRMVNIHSPLDAQREGIAFIHQELNVINDLAVYENMFLGNELRNRFRRLDIARMCEETSKVFERMNVSIDPRAMMRDLDTSHKQIVEIAKSLLRSARLIIMDEPTTSLTQKEIDNVFAIMRNLTKTQGTTIIFISHRLEELFELADRVTVMRDGCYVGTENIKDIDRQKLITMMAGRELKESYPSRTSQIGEEALRVEHLTGNGDHDISFTLHRGEILGFAGLVGAGRTELMRVIYGADPIESGKIFVNGKETNIRTCQQAIRHGIGYIPEDRKAHGAFLRMSIKWNVVVNNLRGISKGPFVDEKLENQIAEDYEEKFQIKTPSLEQRVENLSGGNQQKVVIAKTLAANSEIIIFDEPTRGIDVGAKQEIYKLMNQLAGEGKAIIMVSSDMPELLGMSDRIITIYEGRKTGELAKSEFDQNYILDLASGGEEHGKNK